jgi:phosphoglycolate phosphatase-like HAD superfamily hydrolase
MAALKLGHYGLADHFVYGAFGDQAEDRDALARAAVAHAGRTWGVPPERCIVLGDTEHDIGCARAAGARAVAVATGGRARAELERCRPDLLLDDLADPTPLLAWAAGLDRAG